MCGKILGRGVDNVVYCVDKIFCGDKFLPHEWVIKVGPKEHMNIEIYRKLIACNVGPSNIEKILALDVQQFDAHIVSERLSCTLEDRILNNQSVDILALVGDCAKGLDYLHALGIAHCDLKENNIMFSEVSCEYKLIDFGHSRFVANPKFEKLRLTLCRTPPDVALNPRFWNENVDYWALGCIFYAVLKKIQLTTYLQVAYNTVDIVNLLFDLIRDGLDELVVNVPRVNLQLTKKDYSRLVYILTRQLKTFNYTTFLSVGSSTLTI